MTLNTKDQGRKAFSCATLSLEGLTRSGDYWLGHMRNIDIKLLFQKKVLPVLWAENFLSTREAQDPPDHFHFNSTTSVRAEVGLGCLCIRALCEILKTYRTEVMSYSLERGELQHFLGICCYMNGQLQLSIQGTLP